MLPSTNISTALTSVSVFCFPAEVLDAERGVFGVHAFPGDALHLGLKHLVGILVGLVGHPDLHEGVQKASWGEELVLSSIRQGP